MAQEYFMVDDGTGKKIRCRGLFSYHSDDFEKDYILYTDDKKDKKGNVNIYASQYDPDADELILADIESDEEFEMLIQVFAQANQG